MRVESEIRGKIENKTHNYWVSLTHQTANSAGSVLVFARIPGFGGNPVKYTDPDGRVFGIDDAIGATIQCIRDGNWGQFGEKIKSNFANSWAFFGLKMTSPGSWLELGVSALAGFGLSAFMGPIGWAVGLFTPAFNFLIGYSAIEGFGGEIIPSSGLSGHLTINIQIPGMGSENAATFGNLVIGGSGLNNVIAHERGHFLQSLLLGPLYWMVIAIPSITRAGIWNYRLMNGKSVKSYGSFYTEKWADKWSIP